jgi:hypothetical protein
MSQRDLPIILGGCHRSGTSLVRRVLNAHSRIYCGTEVEFFRDFYGDYFYDPLKHIRFTSSARALVPDDELMQLLGPVFLTLHERAAAAAGKRRWADKNPDNVLYLKDWQRLLGDAWWFILVTRNPLDTIASIKEAEFNETIPEALDARIAFYNRYNEAGLEFVAAHPTRARVLIYEQLVSDPPAVLGSLMQWLGEEFEPTQLAFNQMPQARGLEDHKVRETTTIHRASVGRWKGTLTPSEVGRIVAGCTPIWRQIDPNAKYMSPRVVETLSDVAFNAEPPLTAAAVRVARAGDCFESEWRRAAAEKWANELAEIVAARERELTYLKSLLPVRVALAVKHALNQRR